MFPSTVQALAVSLVKVPFAVRPPGKGKAPRKALELAGSLGKSVKKPVKPGG